MSVLIQADQLRLINLGQRVEKATGTLAATVVPLFNITGGTVGITAWYGKVTAPVTVANSYVLQSNPTAASLTTQVLFTATDIGTTDTPAGAVLTSAGPGSALVGQGTGAVAPVMPSGIIPLPVGQIESNSAGTDGNITWVFFWIPLDSGAVLSAV
jgi:hypothetical protein